MRIAGDLAVAVGAFYAAFRIRIHITLPFTEDLLPGDRLRFFLTDWGVVLITQVLLLYLLGFYDPPRPRPRLEALRGLLAVAALQGLLLSGYYFFGDLLFPRSVLILFVALNLLLLTAWRWLVDRLHRPPRRRVAIVGTGRVAREVAEAIEAHHWHGLEVAGLVPTPGTAPEASSGDQPEWPLLGSPEELPALLERGMVDDVILAAPPLDGSPRLLDSLIGAHPRGSSVLLVPGPFESLIGRMRYRWVRDIPLIEVIRESEWTLRQPLKRLLDVVVASLLLLLAAPVVGLCALLIRLTSPGPILYRQERIGKDLRPFTLWKLRTMHQDAERETGEVLAQPDDPRLTPVGAFLRRYRLDEFPQLLNVLGGSMSLVGPRPERPGFVRRYLEEVPGYALRFTLLPGVTGLAQINGDYHSSAQNKLRYDLAYLANRSLWLDLSILFRTVKIVLTSRGS